MRPRTSIDTSLGTCFPKAHGLTIIILRVASAAVMAIEVGLARGKLVSLLLLLCLEKAAVGKTQGNRPSCSSNVVLGGGCWT